MESAGSCKILVPLYSYIVSYHKNFFYACSILLHHFVISQSWTLLKAAFPMTELLQYISIYGVQFPIIEFDPETFRILLDYLHTGSCPLTCCNIPGLICAAEHYDLPELLQACFHHAKQFLRIEVVSIYYIMSHCRCTDILQYPMSHLCSRAM